MQEVMIVRYCDRCFSNHERKIEGFEVTFSVNNDEAIEVDLCEPCRADMLNPWRALLNGRGNSSAEHPEQVARVRVECGVCGQRTFSSNRNGHARKQHGCPSQEIQWRFEPQVAEVWVCSCGHAYATRHGRTIHERQSGHEPGKLEPQPAMNW